MVNDTARDVTAVVVLGYSCDHGRGVPSKPLEHRLQHAVNVAEATHARYIVCSGGIDAEHADGLPTEGEIMADWIRSHPHPDGLVILTEGGSTSTRENAVYSLNVLQAQVREREGHGEFELWKIGHLLVLRFPHPFEASVVVGCRYSQLFVMPGYITIAAWWPLNVNDIGCCRRRM